MATKGSKAKEYVENKIKETFGENFIAIVDKKVYVWADDGGERIQVALSLTCPKVPIEVDTVKKVVDIPETKTETFSWGGFATQPGAWGSAATSIPKTPEPKPAVEITQAERDRIAKLIEKLNL